MVFASLLGVIGLIFLAAFGAKWVNKKFNYGNISSSSKGIKIIEAVGIAQDKQLIIVSVGNKYMLLGVTQASVSKICDLDLSDIEEISSASKTEESAFLVNFKKAFSEARRQKDAVNTADINMEKDGPNSKDEF